MRLKGTHNHEGIPVKLEVSKMVNSIKQQAKDSKDPPRLLISRAATVLSNEASTSCPSVSSLSRTIRHCRSREHAGPSVLTSLEELVIPDKYQKTNKGEQFMLWDSEDEGRIILFATRRHIEFLTSSQEWFVDGTFKIAPPLFCQLFTFHGNINGSYYPLLFCLLPDKREQSYIKVFEFFKKHMDKPRVSLIMLDFEKALINTCELLFPMAVRQGCYFHFRQCMYRRIQHLGMKKRYDSNTDFQHKVKLFIALAFVPIEYVSKAFDILVHSEDVGCVYIKPFLDYFEETWVGKRNPNGSRRQPVFPHSLWNFYERTVHGQQRTNNIVEGWHSNIEKTLQRNQPSLWVFIDAIIQEHAFQDLKINQHLAGYAAQTHKTKKYKDKNVRLRSLV